MATTTVVFSPLPSALTSLLLVSLSVLATASVSSDSLPHHHLLAPHRLRHHSRHHAMRDHSLASFPQEEEEEEGGEILSPFLSKKGDIPDMPPPMYLLRSDKRNDSPVQHIPAGKIPSDSRKYLRSATESSPFVVPPPTPNSRESVETEHAEGTEPGTVIYRRRKTLTAPDTTTSNYDGEDFGSLQAPPSSEYRRLRQTPTEESQRFEKASSSSKERPSSSLDGKEAIPVPLPLFEPGVLDPTSAPENHPLPTQPISSSDTTSSSAPRPPVVTTDSGDVMGLWVDVSTGGRVASFLGIPYSEPPVGDLRFRAPVPVAPWRKTKEATKFGPMCIQPGNQYVWDAVRFPSPTTQTPLHQHVRTKQIRQSDQQNEKKKDERTFQFPEPSILFAALIADKPPEESSSGPEYKNSSLEVMGEFSAIATTTEKLDPSSTQDDWSTDSHAAGTDQSPSAPVMRRRRMRNYEMSEDCLTLNVYTPKISSNDSTGGLPILFFIHGGSYYMNGGRLYPGEELAARGAVVVTFNYRLGPFGFLSTGEPSCRGNWGLLDQAEALRWIRRNAKAFGGDAHNSLCLVGNSAGAASVLLHMVSPVTKGLFSCAVAMSGCSGAPWAIQSRPLRHAKSLATRLGCPHPNRRPHHAVACLRTFSAQLIAENSDLEDGLGVAFAPVVDGGGVGGVGGGRRGTESSEAGSSAGNGPFIPDDPRRLMAEGRFAQVPFLSGLTRDEVSIWFSNFGPTMEKRLMRVFLDKDIKQLLNGTGLPTLNSVALSHAAAHLYLWGGRGEDVDENRASEGHRASEGVRGSDPGARGSTLAVADFISDVGLKAPCLYDMELIARSNQKSSFFYEFQYHSVDDARTDKQEWIGAYHESELQFLFGEPFLGYSNHLRAANDKEVSEMIMSLWINFAKHGHPTPDRGTNVLHGNVDWQPFTHTHRQYLILGYRPRMAENYLTERMVFWNYIADAFRRHPMPPVCTTPPPTVPPVVSFPLPPSAHLRWIFWTMAAGNAAFILTIVCCLAKRLRSRTLSTTSRSATPGV